MSLFPFLAVLICTMGVLILFLVVAVKKADDSAKAEKQQKLDVIEKERLALQTRKDAAEVRLEILKETRPDVLKDLDDQRVRRSVLQSQTRDLQDQAAQLAMQLKSVQREIDRNEKSDRLNEIEDLKRKLANSKTKLNSLQKEKVREKNVYSIVPYQGNSGTRRQPIFVECRSNSVILQPFGIELVASDFEKPVFAGNPLDVALATIQNYWNQYGSQNEEGDAYPLLVIRPDGTRTYAAARKSMKSWSDQFGYELVENEIELEYPPVDNQLKEVLAQAIAKSRKDMLAKRELFLRSQIIMASSNQGARQANGMGRSTGNQLTQSNVSNALGESKRLDQLFEELDDSSAGMTSQRGLGRGEGGLSRNNPLTSTVANLGQENATPFESGSNGRRDSNSAFRNSMASKNANQAGGARNWNNKNQNGTNSANSNGDSNSSYAKLASSKSTGKSAAGSSGTSAGQPSNRVGGASKNQPSNPSGSSKQSLANQRGKDWALPSHSNGQTAFRRPISMVCFNDKVILISPDANAQRNIQVKLTGQTEEHVDELVSRIWERIESWGIAGARSYWKPELILSVSKGGSQRTADLVGLLKDSGIDIRVAK